MKNMNKENAQKETQWNS